MKGTVWAAVVIAVTGVAACGPQEEPEKLVKPVDRDGFVDVGPTSEPSSATEPVSGLDRFTPPTGECGVSLHCGLGAGPTGPTAP